MSFFSRGRGLAQLVTCIVQRKGSAWSVMWASDGKVPRDFSEASLSAATDRASADVASLYANRPEAVDAELQFAIYPWRNTSGKVILDVTQDGSGLAVKDIQGSGISFHSDSIEAAVADAERYVPNPTDAMLRWIRRVADL